MFWKLLETMDMKHAVIGVALLLLTTSVWAGTLRDNFDDGDMDEWDLSLAGDFWKVENGELVITPRGGLPVQFYIGETTWDDYTVRVKTKIVKHRSTGFIEGSNIVVRRQLPMHGYGFVFGERGGNRGAMAFYSKGNITVWHFEFKPFQWKLNTWYDLKLTAKGDRFLLYVDDQLVIDYTDDVHSKGKVGIGAGVSGTTAHFDDFSVTSDDISGFSVSPKAKLAATWGQVKGF